jgi:hypothetical protein
MLPRFSDPDIVPLVRFRVPEPPFPPPGPSGSVPRLPRYYEGSLTPRHPSHRARFPSPGGTACAAARFAPADCGRPRPRAWIFGHPESSPACFFGGDGRASQVPGGTLWTYAVLFDPGRALAPGHCGARVLSPVTQRGRPQRDVHFEARSHGLRPRCLRFAGVLTVRPRKTRFWLVANLYQAGLAPAGSHREGFRLCRPASTSSSSFTRLTLAHGAWHLPTDQRRSQA